MGSEMSNGKGYDGRRTKENHHEHAQDGTPIYELRKPITLLKNGRLLTGYVQTNIQVWKALAGGVLALAAFLGAFVLILKTVAEPPVRAIAREEVAPLSRQLSDYKESNERHIEQLTTEARAAHDMFVKRQEFNDTMLLRQKKIDEMAAQIEFLYRNEINKKRGGGG